MRGLLCCACQYGGQGPILRAIRLVVDYLFDDEFQDYCKGTTLLEDEEEHIFWAVERLRRFVEVTEQASSPMARGVRIGRDTRREGDEQK